jgi:transcriptional regulator with XRE-family HTH domain
MSGTFGGRLRAERERKRISLQTIASNTKIPIRLLADLERDDVSRWPSGIFRRSFLRSYAAAIGLPTEAVVREFQTRFPDHAEVEVAGRTEPESAPTELRLMLAELPRQPWLPSVAGVGARCMATVVDVGLVFAVTAALTLSFGHLSVFLAVVSLCYFAAFGILYEDTPGRALVARSAHRARGTVYASVEVPLDLPAPQVVPPILPTKPAMKVASRRAPRDLRAPEPARLSIEDEPYVLPAPMLSPAASISEVLLSTDVIPSEPAGNLLA